MLTEINWKITNGMAQDFWSSFENKLISVVDLLILMSYESNKVRIKTVTVRKNNINNFIENTVRK